MFNVSQLAMKCVLPPPPGLECDRAAERPKCVDIDECTGGVHLYHLHLHNHLHFHLRNHHHLNHHHHHHHQT